MTSWNQDLECFDRLRNRIELKISFAVVRLGIARRLRLESDPRHLHCLRLVPKPLRPLRRFHSILERMIKSSRPLCLRSHLSKAIFPRGQSSSHSTRPFISDYSRTERPDLMAKTLTEFLYSPSAAAKPMFPQAVIKPISALVPPMTTPIAKTLSTDPEGDRLSMLNRLAKAYGADEATLSAAIAKGTSSDSFALECFDRQESEASWLRS
jgi:hypothetical protein